MTHHVDSTEPTLPVVVAVDGSPTSYNAAAWAAVDAALHHRPLQVVNSAAAPAGWGPGAMMVDASLEFLRTDAERILAEAVRVAHTAAGGESLSVRTEGSFDPVVDYLIDWSRRAHLLVVGSRGRGALRRGLLGSVGSALTHHAYCPVAVVHWSATDPVSAVKPVLVGIDGSESSTPALELAFEEASRRKAGLTALHAWGDPGGADFGMPWERFRSTEDAVLAESLAGWGERFPDVTVQRKLVRDHPARALWEESETAQLLVVGSHGRGGFTGMLLGSTSNTLVHSVECPIIVVRRREPAGAQ